MEIKFPSKNIIKIKNRNLVKCPTCKKKATEAYIPFCSKKCSDIDLMKWLSDENDESNEEIESFQ